MDRVAIKQKAMDAGNCGAESVDQLCRDCCDAGCGCPYVPARRTAADAGGLSGEPQKPFHHFGLSAEEVGQLLQGGLKPKEIGGADDVQHDRVGELVRWFARFTQGHANPKWATRHACELAYYIATNGINRGIDLEAVRKAAFKEGVNITPEERGTLERIGFATPAAPGLSVDAGLSAAVLEPKFYRDEQFDKLSERWANAIAARERGAPFKPVAAAFEAMCEYLDGQFAIALAASPTRKG